MSTLDTIDQETLVTAVAAGDEVGIYQASSGRTKKVALGSLLPLSGRYRILTQYINGSLTGLGNSTAGIATQTWAADVFVPYVKAWTGIGILNGATVGTDKGLVILWSNTGAVLATSALAGATTSGASAFQQYAFTTPYTNLQPGEFFLGYSSNGATDNFQSIKTATVIDVLTGTQTAQVFGTVTALTPPTTFTANVGPDRVHPLLSLSSGTWGRSQGRSFFPSSSTQTNNRQRSWHSPALTGSATYGSRQPPPASAARPSRLTPAFHSVELSHRLRQLRSARLPRPTVPWRSP